MRLRNDRGSILVTALVLVAIMSLLGLAVLNTSSSEMKIAANELRAARALNLAEAGLQHAIRRLELDRQWRANGATFPLGDGFYRITVPDPDKGIYTLTSEGLVGSVTNPTAYHQLEVKAGRGVGVGVGDAGGLMEYATHAATALKLNAVATGLWPHVTIEGNVYVYGDVSLKNNTTISAPNNPDPTLFPDGKATVYATGSISGAPDNPPYRIQAGVPVVEQPTLTADQLRSFATHVVRPANGVAEYLDGINTSIFPNDAVVFVEGDVRIQGQVSSRATIIATKKVTVTHDLTYSPDSGPNQGGPIYLIGMQGIVFTTASNQRRNFVGMYYSPESLSNPNDKEFTLLGALVVGTIPNMPNWTVLRHDARLEQYAPPFFRTNSFGLVDYYDEY